MSGSECSFFDSDDEDLQSEKKNSYDIPPLPSILSPILSPVSEIENQFNFENIISPNPTPIPSPNSWVFDKANSNLNTPKSNVTGSPKQFFPDLSYESSDEYSLGEMRDLKFNEEELPYLSDTEPMQTKEQNRDVYF